MRARALSFLHLYWTECLYTPTYIFQYDLIHREHVVQLIQRRKSLALRWNSDRTRPPSSACFAKVLVFAWAIMCMTRQWGFTPKVASSLLLDTKRQKQYTVNKEIKRNRRWKRLRAILIKLDATRLFLQPEIIFLRLRIQLCLCISSISF